MLEPENAAQNAEYIGYSTPNEKSKSVIAKNISSDEQFIHLMTRSPILKSTKI